MTDSNSEVKTSGIRVASPSIEAPSLAAGYAPARVIASQASAQTLSSIRGVPECGSVQPTQLAPDSAFDETYSAELGKLWTVARLDPRGPDRGGDLRELVGLFESDASLVEDTNLITQLSRVAESEVLFGMTRAQYREMGLDFDRMRREFLVDIIRGAINPDNITQGKEPLCTVASACKLLSRGEFLRLATDLALDGYTKTVSGDPLQVRWEFIERAYRASEASLGEVRCARRSMGMLTFLYSVMQLGDHEINPQQALVQRQEGLYWHQYAQMVQKLLSERVACAHRSAQDICIDESTGMAVPQGTAGAKQVGLFEYVESQLKRGQRVFIDTLFDFSSRHSVGNSEHARHALIAEKFESIDGALWVRCSNPIGDFVDTSKSRDGHAEFFPPGTVLGRGDGFWFKTADNGDILVRADVLKNNIQTALVRYGDSLPYQQGAQPLFIGDRTQEDARPVVYFSFEQDVEKTYEGPSTAETILTTLERLFHQQEEFARKAGLQDEPNENGVAQPERKRNPWDERALEGLNQLVEDERREDREVETRLHSQQEARPPNTQTPMIAAQQQAAVQDTVVPSSKSTLMSKSLFG